MKVTPIKRKFGRYMPGEEFELADKIARHLVSAKKLQEVRGLTYETRAMTAAPVQSESSVEVDSAGAQWDASLHTSTKLKNSDGTWRKKPGRAAA